MTVPVNQNIILVMLELKIWQREAAIELTILKYFLSNSRCFAIPQKITNNRVYCFKKKKKKR